MPKFVEHELRRFIGCGVLAHRFACVRCDGCGFARFVAFSRKVIRCVSIVGDEVRTVRAGNTLLAPPGTPYKLVNNTWVPARLLRIFPADQLETKVLE